MLEWAAFKQKTKNLWLAKTNSQMCFQQHTAEFESLCLQHRDSIYVYIWVKRPF